MLQQWIHNQDRPILFTSLHELELKNAFALKVFREELSAEACELLVRSVDEDMQRSVLRRAHPRWSHVFRQAIELCERNTARAGSRSLDILHLAVALDLGCDQLVTFDERQIALANCIDLEVVPIGYNRSK